MLTTLSEIFRPSNKNKTMMGQPRYFSHYFISCNGTGIELRWDKQFLILNRTGRVENLKMKYFNTSFLFTKYFRITQQYFIQNTFNTTYDKLITSYTKAGKQMQQFCNYYTNLKKNAVPKFN